MTRSRGQIFNYSPHNVCGGKSHSMVHSTRKPTPSEVTKFPPPPEGEYVTRKEGTMRVSDWWANLRFIERLKADGRYPVGR
jgi:hypothetical protein